MYVLAAMTLEILFLFQNGCTQKLVVSIWALQLPKYQCIHAVCVLQPREVRSIIDRLGLELGQLKSPVSIYRRVPCRNR